MRATVLLLFGAMQFHSRAASSGPAEWRPHVLATRDNVPSTSDFLRRPFPVGT